MSAQSNESQTNNGSFLNLTGLRSPLDNHPESWPWEIEVLDIPALHQTINMPQISVEIMLRLLIDLSYTGLTAGTTENANPEPVITLTEKDIALRPRLARRLAGLTPIERLNCCGHCKAEVRLVDGRPLVLDPWYEDKLLFGDDPVAWVRGGLYAVDDRALSSLGSFGSVPAWLFPCPAVQITPCETAGGRRIARPTIPALYTGLRPFNRMLSEWWATFWLRNIEEGYALAGKKLQFSWCEQVPGTSVPDPIYRFIMEPSARLRKESLLFLRHAHDKLRKQPEPGDSERPKKGAKSSSAGPAPSPSKQRKAELAEDPRARWYHGSDEKPPAKFKFGPLAGLKKEFAKVCFESRTDHRVFADACIGKNACFSARKLTRLESKYPFEVWFQVKPDLDAATKRLENFRKSKATPDTVEGESADDSTEPTDD